MNLLYVEDNLDLAETVKTKLSRWFNVDLAQSSTVGLDKADETEYDIIIIDYYLPDYEGLSLCKQIRATNSETRILFLTQNSRKIDIVNAFDAGADDYLTKPFHFEELRARIQALVRRNQNVYTTENLVCGNYCLNQKNVEVYYKDIYIPLKRKEFSLFEYLMLHRGQVITRSRLYEHVWNQQYYSSNTVDVHIKRLRTKIEDPFNTKIIHTVYGIGYKLISSI